MLEQIKLKINSPRTGKELVVDAHIIRSFEDEKFGDIWQMVEIEYYFNGMPQHKITTAGDTAIVYPDPNTPANQCDCMHCQKYAPHSYPYKVRCADQPTIVRFYENDDEAMADIAERFAPVIEWRMLTHDEVIKVYNFEKI